MSQSQRELSIRDTAGKDPRYLDGYDVVYVLSLLDGERRQSRELCGVIAKMEVDLKEVKGPFIELLQARLNLYQVRAEASEKEYEELKGIATEVLETIDRHSWKRGLEDDHPVRGSVMALQNILKGSKP